MSWSIGAIGKAADLIPQIAQQYERIKLNDAGEMETVKNVVALIAQTLATFDPAKPVKVSASGSMGFASKTGPYQSVSVTIEPIHFTTG